MISTENAKTIYLRHDQILCACYEWAARRGFTPQSPGSMVISALDDRNFPERPARFGMSFPCQNPQGEECLDEQGRCYPYITRQDAPWLDEFRRVKSETTDTIPTQDDPLLNSPADCCSPD